MTGSVVASAASLHAARGGRRIHRRSMSVKRPLSTNSYPQCGQRTIVQPRDIGHDE
jgi:hypothetical protein